MAAFADHAAALLANGYSPLPLRPNRLPLHKGWQALRTSPMTPEQIASERWYGVGVMCGYGDLLAIDVDVEDRDIHAAITRSIPKSNVAKTGSKGFTVFYRATAEIKNRKFRPPGDSPKPIVEILSGGNMTVLPPTWHPGAGREYQWCRPASLFNLHRNDLVPIDPEHIDALAKALEPWCPPRKEYAATSTVDRELINDKRMRGYALSAIQSAAARISGLTDGRHNALFDAACGLARYANHGIVQAREIRDELIGACERNGLVAKRGRKEVEACIDRGLDDYSSTKDQLPDLDQCPGARPPITPLWQQAREAFLKQMMAEAEAMPGYYR